jgi:hypothetical protein
VDVAIKAGVRHLFLFHHDPDHDDAHVSKMLAGARQQAAAAGSKIAIDAAREGLEMILDRKAAAKSAELAAA